MRDPVLLEIATQAPDSVDALHEIDGLAEKTIRRAGRRLIGIVKSATEDRSGHQPPQRPDERQKQALKRMQMAVAARADEIDLAAELLAPKKELSAAMLGERDLRVFRGWRRELVGDALLELLED